MSPHSAHRRNGGAVLVLVAAWIAVGVAVAAVITEVGMLVLQRLQLQRAADLAALGGAPALPDHPGQALAEARWIARNNGAADSEMEIRVGADGYSLAVTLERSHTPLFAQLLRRGAARVGGRAEARLSPLAAWRGVVPWGVREQELIYGVEYVLKHGADPWDLPRRGNFQILDLTGGATPTDYVRWVANDYDEATLRVGTRLAVMTGNLGSHTWSGVEERRRRAAGFDCSWPSVEYHCPLVVMVPIVQNAGGVAAVQNVRVVGFARFLITEARDAPHEVRGIFMQRIEVDGLPGGPRDFGARQVLLVR